MLREITPRVLFFYGISMLFSGSTAVKAMTALIRKKPYVFSFWDGGALRIGRTLSQGATILKLISSMVVLVVCIGTLLGLVPVREAVWLVLGATAVMLVAGFGGMVKSG